MMEYFQDKQKQLLHLKRLREIYSRQEIDMRTAKEQCDEDIKNLERKIGDEYLG